VFLSSVHRRFPLLGLARARASPSQAGAFRFGPTIDWYLCGRPRDVRPWSGNAVHHSRPQASRA